MAIHDDLKAAAQAIHHLGDYGLTFWNPAEQTVFWVAADSDSEDRGFTSAEEIEAIFLAVPGVRAVEVGEEAGPFDENARSDEAPAPGWEFVGRLGIAHDDEAHPELWTLWGLDQPLDVELHKRLDAAGLQTLAALYALGPAGVAEKAGLSADELAALTTTLAANGAPFQLLVMWINPHPRSLALWTKSAFEDISTLHVFDLQVSLEELMRLDAFGVFCCDIEYNLGVLDYMGAGSEEDGYEGFGTDVELDEVAVFIGRFADFLNAHQLLVRHHEPVLVSHDE